MNEQEHHDQFYDADAQLVLSSAPIVESYRRAVEMMGERGLLNRSARVLSLGCGDGRFEVVLAPHVGRIVGLDISPVAVEHARARAAREGHDNIEVRVGDLHDVERAPVSGLASRVPAHAVDVHDLSVERDVHLFLAGPERLDQAARRDGEGDPREPRGRAERDRDREGHPQEAAGRKEEPRHADQGAPPQRAHAIRRRGRRHRGDVDERVRCPLTGRGFGARPDARAGGTIRLYVDPARGRARSCWLAR